MLNDKEYFINYVVKERLKGVEVVDEHSSNRRSRIHR